MRLSNLDFSQRIGRPRSKLEVRLERCGTSAIPCGDCPVMEKCLDWWDGDRKQRLHQFQELQNEKQFITALDQGLSDAFAGNVSKVNMEEL